MLAKYDSKCARCGKLIGKGEPMKHDKWAPRGQRASHYDCNVAPAQPEQTATATLAQPIVNTDTATAGGARHYDSMAALFADARAPRQSNLAYHAKRISGETVTSQGKTPLDWLGVESFAKAYELIDSAQWPAGADMIRKLADGLLDVPPPVNVKRRRVWTDQGDSFDIHRAYSGRLDSAWQRTRRLSTRAPKPVRIVVDSTHSYFADASNLQWAGAAAVALSDLLTEAGYSPEIILGHTGNACNADDTWFSHTLTVKSPLMPLDINALAATIALPAFTRQVLYNIVLHTCERVKIGLSRSKGTPTEPGDIVIRTSDVDTREAAAEWIKSAVAKVNGEYEQAA